MTTDIIEYDEEQGIASIADDSLLRVAADAERRIEAVVKIKQLALRVTNNKDWCDQGGRPYLMVSGSEKIANLFNVSWRIEEPIIDYEEDGHFTYTYRGTFTLPGRSIQVSGSRSSKDPFFKKYSYINNQRTEMPISAIDKRDVKMAAMTNLLGNGITRILGIRNLSYADLEEYARITKDMIGKVEYKSKNEKPLPMEPQKKAEATTTLNDNNKISEPQRKRFWALAKKTGISDDDIKMHLSMLGIPSTNDIPRDKYDELCRWAETPEKDVWAEEIPAQ